VRPVPNELRRRDTGARKVTPLPIFLRKDGDLRNRFSLIIRTHSIVSELRMSIGK
jgi:hypothetical protein